MPRRKGSTRRETGAATHAQLEKRLVLLAWLNLRFGYETNQDLLADVKHVAEGFNADDRSYVGIRLESRAGVQVARGDLVRYDDNIRAHLRAMNAGRSSPITLRYFQHLHEVAEQAGLAGNPRAACLEPGDADLSEHEPAERAA